MADPRRSVASKVSAIIRTFEEGESLSITDIAAHCRLPLSTVHRLVGELAAWHVLERDQAGHYRPGRPLLTMGARPVRTPPALRERVAPVMEDLSRVSGRPVRFGTLDNGRVAYLHKPLPTTPVSGFSPAATVPAHATAMGKVLLAFSPSEVVNLAVGRGLTAFTTRTVTRPVELRHVLRLVRANRVAVADGELSAGWTALAAPVFGAGGSLVGALELGADDLSVELGRLGPLLTVAAASLSRELGATACASCVGVAAQADPAQPRLVANLS